MLASLVWLHLQGKLYGVKLFLTSIFVVMVEILTDIDALDFFLP
jgi:hypothetical protein